MAKTTSRAPAKGNAPKKAAAKPKKEAAKAKRWTPRNLAAAKKSTPAKKATPPKTPAKARPVEVTGHSMTFSFDEAIRDALAQAHAARPSPPRNPDVAVSIAVTRIEARSGGNIRPGLTITATVE